MAATPYRIRVPVSYNQVVFKYEPRNEISNNVIHVTSKTSDQAAHMRSLIRAFASHLKIL